MRGPGAHRLRPPGPARAVSRHVHAPRGPGACRRMTEARREYVAWGWAVNGFSSVVGAVLATLLSMIYGFHVVLLLGLGAYLLALARLAAPGPTGPSVGVGAARAGAPTGARRRPLPWRRMTTSPDRAAPSLGGSAQRGTAPFGRTVPRLSRRADRPRPLLPRSRPPTPCDQLQRWTPRRRTARGGHRRRGGLLHRGLRQGRGPLRPGRARGRGTRRPRPARPASGGVRHRGRGRDGPARAPPRGGERPGVTPRGGTIAGDGNRLPFPDGAADVAFSSNVLEHVPDPARFLDEMVRVTRPGGHHLSVLHGVVLAVGRPRDSPVALPRGPSRPPAATSGTTVGRPATASGRRSSPATWGPPCAWPAPIAAWTSWPRCPGTTPTGCGGSSRFPAVRELATWNLLLVLRRRGGHHVSSPGAHRRALRPGPSRSHRTSRRAPTPDEPPLRRRARDHRHPPGGTSGPGRDRRVAGGHHAARLRHPAGDGPRASRIASPVATPTTSTTPPTSSSRATASSTRWLYGRHPPQIVQIADWPPLFVFVLAATSVVGFKIVLRPSGVVLCHRRRRGDGVRHERAARSPGAGPGSSPPSWWRCTPTSG